MDLKELGILTVVIAVFGGVVSLILGSILPMNDTIVASVIGIILAVVTLLYLMKTEGIDYIQKVPQFIVFLFLIGTIGTIATTIMPDLSQFFLNINNFSVTGLFYTIFYIGAGSMIAERIGIIG